MPPSFSLLETMRWTPQDDFPFLYRHLARLSEAASVFRIPLDHASVDAALRLAVLGRDSDTRVRLTVAQDGAVSVAVTPLSMPMTPLRVAIYPEPVNAGGLFWRHKTTHRPHYEAPYAWAQGLGYDDALLLAPDGAVVEATRASVWVEREGRLLTPRLSAGGLAGVYRAHLLATHPGAEDAKLTLEDLAAADALYLSNAVRGLVRADLVAV